MHSLDIPARGVLLAENFATLAQDQRAVRAALLFLAAGYLLDSSFKEVSSL